MHAPQAMVYAICHEVGNLLAAIRLHGDLVDADSGRKVAELAARSGSLLSLVRPLLDEGFEPFAIDPGELLEGLRRGLEDPEDPRLELDVAGADGLPPVLADGEVLHHLLLSELFASFEALPPGERIRLAVHRDGYSLVFELCGGGPETDPGAGDRLAGRALCLELARNLLARGGGSARMDARDGRRRVALALPLA